MTLSPNARFGPYLLAELDWPYVAQGDGRNYDVSPDGQRFLALRNVETGGGENAAPRVIIVQNWTEEVKRLVPVN